MSTEIIPLSEESSGESGEGGKDRPAFQVLDDIARQMNLFTGEADLPNFMLEAFPAGVREWELEEGLTVVQSPEGLTVSISGFGGFVGKKSERLILKKKEGKTVWQVPFEQVSELQVSAKGLSLSTDVIAELADRGIRVSILGYNGRPVAQVSSPMLTASVAVRRAQLEALENGRGLILARAIAAGKLLNQARLLKYCVKNLKNTELYTDVQGLIHSILESRHEMMRGAWTELERARAPLMGLEGQAARVYWQGFSRLIEKQAEFKAREHRGAKGFVNSLLNYGYGVLYSQVWGAVQTAGLEPFAGFLHTDRPGKPSLVLDLTEEFRAPLVDRTIVAALRRGELKPPAAATTAPRSLDPDTRALLVDRLLQRLESRERYHGGDYQIRSIIQMQARQVASFLAGRTDRYVPFRFKW
jgi:CRISPR-associated protein Cas1